MAPTFLIAVLAAAAAPAPVCTGAPDSLEACLLKLRQPGAARFEGSEALGRMGAPALPALAECARKETDPTVAGMCIRALGLTNLPEADALILEAARRADLAGDALTYAAMALGKRKPAGAVPILEAWIDRPDEAESAAGAIGVFQVDPERFRAMSPERRVRYAFALGDRGHTWPEVRDSAAYRAQRAELMALCAAGLRSGALKPVKALLALRNEGDASAAPDVAAFLEGAEPADFRNALGVLEKWKAPDGIPAAIKALAAAEPREREAPARYLALFPDDEKVREGLRAAWAASAEPDARCPLALPMVRSGVEPDAVELAQLLGSRCRHDLTIAWDGLVPARVARLVEYLARAAKDDPARPLALKALEWQCAGRTKQAECKGAAKWVKGAARPSHPD